MSLFESNSSKGIERTGRFKVTNYQVYLDIPNIRTCPNIDHLIYFLDRNGIQHLVLKLPFGHRYKLPSSFFISSGLRHLTLARSLIHPPPVFKGFDRLISLELRRVTISSESLGSLISHCPLLENLVLKNLDNPNPMEINAPKLRSFVFSGTIHCIHLKNVPLLSNASYIPTEFFVEEGHDLAKIFESISALENLCWKQDILQMVHVGPAKAMPTRLPSALNCLKRLYISWITLGEFFEFSFVLCLIRSSPNVEEIEIKVCGDPDVDHHCEPVPRDVLDEIPSSFSNMTFNHLRTVKFYDVIGAEAEMQFIKVLLAKSPALVRMVIKPCEIGDKESLKALAEITKFQRASSKAEVEYCVD
ncbi:F-box/FBD/LRR-repeat protein At1g13570-like [Solanum dulcamara]|uniref:F-box/FBD/LRR-repeat protein At1g13570-like n=1 Tax=Solanum dulcamara TaxID=45834 RepID=UPI00248688D4|nr:F-box/FBD/LRR-repeat protein At1g13570-like [Solanum dulcamara]